jgi:DNA mismatch endonuclease (patch repair protein)
MPRPKPETDPDRRALMQRIGRRRTAPEELVAGMLRVLGISFRRNVRGLPGSPDFANRRRGFAIFVNGCYWHHHRGCSLATIPKRNREFWLAKFRDNRRRDARKIRALRTMGLKVAVIWQCEAADGPRLEARLRRFFSRLGRTVPRRARRSDGSAGRGGRSNRARGPDRR